MKLCVTHTHREGGGEWRGGTVGVNSFWLLAWRLHALTSHPLPRRRRRSRSSAVHSIVKLANK